MPPEYLIVLLFFVVGKFGANRLRSNAITTIRFLRRLIFMHVNEFYRRLAQRYPLRQEIVQLANRNIAITVVVDPDQFLDELSKEEA